MTLLEKTKISDAYRKITESENFNLMDFIQKNPEVIGKLKSGEINAGDLADKAQFIHAQSIGVDKDASTNSVPYQLLKKTANITQRKLQSGGELSAIDYALRAKPSAEANAELQKRYLDRLPKVNTPDPEGAKQNADTLAQSVTGKDISQLKSEVNERSKSFIEEANNKFTHEFGMTFEEAYKKKIFESRHTK